MVEEIEKVIFQITHTHPQELSINKLKGDASDRNYLRITFKTQEKPSSIIVMQLNKSIPDGDRFPFINIYHHLRNHHLPVAEILFTDYSKGNVFLEDLGDISLESKVKTSTSKEIKSYYLRAINLILIMQTRANRYNQECLAFNFFFDEEKLMYELIFFITHYIEGLLKKKIDDKTRIDLNTHFSRLCRIIAAEKRYFTHRDYHSRNIMITDGELKIIDFQDARMGPCQYDLASLLRDSYIKLEDDLFEELLEYYLKEKERLEKTEINRNDFRRIFDYMSLQRNLKAIGTFGYQAAIKKNQRYLESIPLTLSYVKKNLEKYFEFQPLNKILNSLI